MSSWQFDQVWKLFCFFLSITAKLHNSHAGLIPVCTQLSYKKRGAMFALTECVVGAVRASLGR